MEPGGGGRRPPFGLGETSAGVASVAAVPAPGPSAGRPLRAERETLRSVPAIASASLRCLETGRSDNSHRAGPAPVSDVSAAALARRAVSDTSQRCLRDVSETVGKSVTAFARPSPRRRVHNAPVTTAEVQRLGEELGLDAVGVARAEAYAGTERHIRERRARGLFGRMRFTMAQPEVSCHPEALLEGARTVVSAALCYYAPEPERPRGHGRLPRYIWHDRYADLREKLDALGRALGGTYRVLVDANQHVDREAAVRSGVGFYGKNTMVLTRRHGSWVVLGTLVTTAELEPTPPLGAGCGSCTRCIDACPTGRARRAGRARRHALPLVLDAGARAGAGAVPRASSARRSTAATSARTSAPGTAASRGGAQSSSPTRRRTSIWSRWLEADGRELVDELDRLYVPRNDARWLRRNALVALGNVGEDEPRTRDALRALRRRRGRAARRARAAGRSRLEERCG